MSRTQRHTPYTVRPGDTLWGIAEKYLGAGTEWPRIFLYNNSEFVKDSTGVRGIQDPTLIHPGQLLYLPHVAGLPMAHPIQHSDPLGEPYIVKPGDTLSKIARAVLGSAKKWRDIYEYNNRPEVVARTGRGIDDPDLIYVGQALLISRGSSAAPKRGTAPGGSKRGTAPGGPTRGGAKPTGSDRSHLSSQPEATDYMQGFRNASPAPEAGGRTPPPKAGGRTPPDPRQVLLNPPLPIATWGLDWLMKPRSLFGDWLGRFSLPFAAWYAVPDVPLLSAESPLWKVEILFWGGLWITVGTPFMSPKAFWTLSSTATGVFTKRELDAGVMRMFVDHLVSFNFWTRKFYYRSIHFAPFGVLGQAIGVGYKIEGGVFTMRFEVRFPDLKTRLDIPTFPAYAQNFDLRCVVELTWKGRLPPVPPKKPSDKWFHEWFKVYVRNPAPAPGPAVASARGRPTEGLEPMPAPLVPPISPQDGVGPDGEVKFRMEVVKNTILFGILASLFWPLMRGTPMSPAAILPFIDPPGMRRGPGKEL
ncbi:MAG: LysM peptidoglycan-binding domain-containing protein [Gammaproteobacteria bacterium]